MSLEKMKTIITNCVRMSSCYVQYPPPVAGGGGMGAQKNRGWEGYGKQEGNEQEAGVLREEDGREMQNLCLG